MHTLADQGRRPVAAWSALLAAAFIAASAPAWGQDGSDSPRETSKPARSARSPRAKAVAKDEKAAKADDTEKKDTPAEGEEGANRPSFFGDTKKFSRLGGWGSMGGAMGQFGFARTTLILTPAVQKELKITEEQQQKIRDWLEGMRTRGEEMGRTMREQGGDPARQADLPIATRVMQFTSMINQLSGFMQENESGLAKLLTPAQRKRLNQIALQMEGLPALARPEIAQALNLSPDDVEIIQQILARARMAQMTTWITAAGTMARARGDRPPGEDPNAPPDGAAAPRPGGRRRPATAKAGGETKPTDAKEKAKAETKADDPAAPASEPDPEAAARAERQKKMRQQFESMRDQTDRVQDQAVREILRLLTKRQRATFEKMLGEPFDPSKINTFGRPGGNRPPGE